jgi:hypothetical protein
MAETVFLPRAKVPDELLQAVELAAVRRRVTVTDLIREAIQVHPDIRKEMDKMGLTEVSVSRGGSRVSWKEKD